MTNLEKNAYGRFLHDVTYVFGEVAILGLPALMAVAVGDSPGFYGAVAAVFAAWLTITVVGALIRGGWVRPLATETLGWVTFSPALIALRLAYYNGVFLAAGYGGPALADAVGVAPLSIAAAVGLALVATLAFPRLGEEVARRRAARRTRQ